MVEAAAATPSPAAEGRLEDQEQCEGSVPDQSDDVLEFLDSLDAYLVRMESLSSQLCQGCFELASVRHSMGPYRINRVLLDHKDHSAATYLLLNDDGGNAQSNPQFRLCKWVSSSNSVRTVEERHRYSKMMDHTSDSQLRHRGTTQSPSSLLVEECKDDMPTKTSTLEEPSSPIQSKRMKSLSVFGTYLQSFELPSFHLKQSLVEIANLRSSVLSTYEKLVKELPMQRDDERTAKSKEIMLNL